MQTPKVTFFSLNSTICNNTNIITSLTTKKKEKKKKQQEAAVGFGSVRITVIIWEKKNSMLISITINPCLNSIHFMIIFTGWLISWGRCMVLCSLFPSHKCYPCSFPLCKIPTEKQQSLCSKQIFYVLTCKLSISCILLKNQHGLQNSGAHFVLFFKQISKLRISFASTCQKSWRLTSEFQQYKLIQSAPEERDFSEILKVTACEGVSNDFDICRLQRLKLKTLNC